MPAMKMIGGADCKKVRAVVLKQLFEIIDVCSKLSIREVAVKNPTLSLMSCAATRLLPVAWTALMWRGAMYPATPIIANR